MTLRLTIGESWVFIIDVFANKWRGLCNQKLQDIMKKHFCHLLMPRGDTIKSDKCSWRGPIK